MQLPDRRHTARELRDIPEKTFKDVIDSHLARGSESISMPSNLLLMYQATMYVFAPALGCKCRTATHPLVLLHV